MPHPSLRPSIEQEQEAARIPSPQERLRHAFSSEIPENLMEHPGVTRERDAPRDTPRETRTRMRRRRKSSRVRLAPRSL